MLTKPLLLALVLTAFSVLAACGAKPELVRPYSPEEKAERLARAEKVGAHYLKRMTLFVDDNANHTMGGTVFLGDSITEGFPVDDAFPRENVINRGIGGDVVTGVTARLDTSVADLAPSRVYLMIGINDLTWGKRSAEELAQQYETLLQQLRGAAPKAEFILLSTLPTRGKYEDSIPRVEQFNANVKALAPKYDARFIDLWPAMADENKRLRAEYTTDGVHLTLAGYMRWIEQTVQDDDQYLQAVRDLAPRWGKDNPVAWPLKAVDPSLVGSSFPGDRGRNEMLVYTPKYGSSTGTNEWGAEAIVIDGIVRENTIGNTPIPADGYVVSGHGSAATWINVNLTPGTPVEVKDNTVVLLSPPKVQLNPWVEFWHATSALHQRNASDAEWKQAKSLLKQLRAKAPENEIIEKLHQLNPKRYE